MESLRSSRVHLGIVAFITIVTLVLGGCGNPFQVGLGDDVDISRPVVTFESPDLGSFVRGTVTFSGEATDDVGIVSVEISFDRGATWLGEAGGVVYDSASNVWSLELDTNSVPNGRLSLTVRVTDTTDKQVSTEELLFTVDNEAPQIFMTFPSVVLPGYVDPLPGEEPTVGKNGAVFGTVTDRDAIAVGFPQIRMWPDGDTEPTTWIDMRDGETDTPAVYDFQHSVPAEEVGDYRLRIRAQDIGGAEFESEAVLFTIVSGAPQISIDSPSQASYGSGIVTLSGTMSHETETQPDIELNFLERDNPVPLLTYTTDAPGPGDILVTSDGSGGFDWTLDLDSTLLPDGTIITQGFADVASTIGFDTLVFNVDNELPTITVTSPSNLQTVYSTITIRGTGSDNSSLDEVALTIGSDSELVLVDTYNWQHTFDTNTYGNSSHAVEWDPDLDIPAGGTAVWRLQVDVRGTDAAGNETITNHLLYIDQDRDKPEVTVLSPPNDSNLAGPVLVTGTAYDADPGIDYVEMQIIAMTSLGAEIGNYDLSGNPVAANAWITVTGTTQWSQEINTGGELYSVDVSHDGDLKLRIRAVDAGGKVGNASEINVRLDETIPTILSAAPASGSYVSGDIDITATITDDERIETASVSSDGGSTYDTVYTYSGGPELTTYPLSYPVDTDGAAPGGLEAISQVINFRIRVRDNANYTTITTLSLNIDNYWPDAALVTTTYDPAQMSGTTFQIQGTAWDRDQGELDNQYPVRGIDTIEIYFEDQRVGSPTNGEYYDVTDIAGATTTETLEDLGNLQGNQPIISSADHKIVIDRDDIGGVDGKAIEIDGSDNTWWAELDSENLPDGAMTVHYLITDRAGNRTHRSEAGFVMNNPPSIGTVVVGTDLNYDGDVTDGTAGTDDERFDYADLRFNVRERIYFLPAISGGNGTPTYEVFESSDMGTPLTLTSDLLDISATGYNYADGDYTFVIRVTDDVGITDERNILVAVEQDDTVAPNISITTLPVAAAGHVETASPHNPARPSVSGTVTVSGTADDDTRIQEIRLTIPGLGTDVLAAQWAGAPDHDLVSQLAGFSVDTSDLDQATGHDVTWSYTWNSANHPSRAAENVSFQASVQDYRSGAPAAITASQAYDIVPYITALVRTDGDPLPRNKLGRYSFPEGMNNLEVQGYNLNPDTNLGDATSYVRIYNTLGTANTDLTPEGAGTPFTDFQIDLTHNYSGYLVVQVNNVESINNLNLNSLDQNKEDDGSGIASTLWNDDRYIHLWDVDNDFQGSDDAELAAMTVRDDGTHYAAWSNYAASDSFYATDTAQENYYGTYDPPEWNDLAFNMDNDDMFVVHLRNFYNGVADWGYLVLNSFEPNPTGQETDWVIIDDLDNVLYQYRNPRIAVKPGATADDTVIYVSYYDALSDELKYSSWDYDAGGAGNLTARASGQNSVVDTTGDVGTWSDIVIDEDGIPMIVYYDTTNQRLKIARASSDDPANAGDWTITDVDTGISFYGQYVSAAIGSDNALHISAYRNSNANLMHYTAADTDLPTGYTFTRSTVDEPDAVGTWTEMTTVGATPYISYINESKAPSFYGLKYAYYTGTEWEHGTVPVQVSVASQRTAIAAKPAGAGGLTAAQDYVVSVGYSAGSYYFARLRPEQ